MEDNKTTDILTASYQPQREAEQTLSKYGYKYDYELSNMENKVFFDPETNKPYVAYRGSVTAKDWIGNAKLALGLRDENAEKRIALAETVKQKYGQAPDTYGHSRGGYISEKAGERVGGKTVTYNKATLPTDVFKKIRPEQTDIRKTGDIVSYLSPVQRGGSKKEVKPKIKSINIVSQLYEAHKFA